jgi:hypothetical protein
MPTKKQKDVLLKTQENVKAMLEEKELEQSSFDNGDIEWNEESTDIEDRFAELESRVGVLEKIVEELEKRNNAPVKEQTPVKFPGTVGTVNELPKVKFPRQTETGNYYQSY